MSAVVGLLVLLVVFLGAWVLAVGVFFVLGMLAMAVGDGVRALRRLIADKRRTK